MAAVGEKRRQLAEAIPDNLNLPEGFSNPTMAGKGILAIQAVDYDKEKENEEHVGSLNVVGAMG